MPAAEARDRWVELVQEYPLRPIRDEESAARAVAMIDRLTEIEEPSPDEADYLDVLTRLLVAYEDENEPMDVGPAKVLRCLIEDRGITQADVARGSGLSEATISHVLVGHRPPSRKAIAALSAFFRVEPAVFL